MVNAWSLLYSEMNGTIDEDYPIMKKKEDEKEVDFKDDVTIFGGDGLDKISAELPEDNYYAADTVPFDDSYFYGDTFLTGSSSADTISFDSLNFGSPTAVTGALGEDRINLRTDGYPGTIEDASRFSGTDAISFGDYPYIPIVGSIGAGNTASMEYGFPAKPKPNLKGPSHRKYQEDKGLKDLSDYVSSTYNGHYTNENSDVQTLDLIHSVGDAESFCRSNALKYLSRYDKKGSAKRDILKAMHYCLLLYYFSGNTNDETPTRGYETF